MRIKPSVIHTQTLHEVGLWANGEMGLGKAYQSYKSGQISAGQYIKQYSYVKGVLKKAQVVHKQNPHLTMGLADHARNIHKENQARELKAKQAARKKGGK